MMYLHSQADFEGGSRESVPVDAVTLSEKINVLESQIAVLEEGLPRAPGMERAALAKEIDEYRAELEATRRALRSTGADRSC